MAVRMAFAKAVTKVVTRDERWAGKKVAAKVDPTAVQWVYWMAAKMAVDWAVRMAAKSGFYSVESKVVKSVELTAVMRAVLRVEMMVAQWVHWKAEKTAVDWAAAMAAM